MFDVSALAQGFVLGLGMFVCPGPKDLLILRQALRRRPALLLVAVGVLSDALLIALGIAGVSQALSRAPALQLAALWLGVGLMVLYGIAAARRAAERKRRQASVAAPALDRFGGDSLAALLVMCLLNPVAWLDTVLVIGSVGAAMPGVRQASFGVGAVLASLAWFAALVLGARRAERCMSSAAAWRALDAFTAAALFGLALWVACDLV